jgi:hypothetical protein
VKITKNKLRALIKEELEIISEGWIPISDFPEVGIPQYNGKSDRARGPEYGIDQLNGKVNQLMTLVMVLNDNHTTRADVMEIVNEMLGETEGGPQMTRVGPDVDLSRSGPPEIE